MSVGTAHAQAWVTDKDYPKEALRNGWQGTTHFELAIGMDGRPTGCKVTRSSGYLILDEETCHLLMRRARFRPAVDDEGKPKTETFKSKFNWTIPRF